MKESTMFGVSALAFVLVAVVLVSFADGRAMLLAAGTGIACSFATGQLVKYFIAKRKEEQ